MPSIRCNYYQTYDNTFIMVESVLTALKNINTEKSLAFKAELEGILKQMQAMFPLVTAKDTHTSVLEKTPDIIRSFAYSFKKYLEGIPDNEIEQHRKQLLPILREMYQEKYQKSTPIVINEPIPKKTITNLNLWSFPILTHWLHDSLMDLTKRQRVDEDCLFTLRPIPSHRAVHCANGQKFDLIWLLRYQYRRLLKPGETEHNIKYINPLSNKPFTHLELISIAATAQCLNITLSKDRQLLWQQCKEYTEKEQLDNHCEKNNFAKIEKCLFTSKGAIKQPLLAPRALNHAVREKNIKLAAFLLERGVSPNFHLDENPHQYWSPLIIAAMNNDKAMVKLLLQYKASKGVDILAPDTITFRPNALSVAVSNEADDDEMVKLLLAAGAEVNQLYLCGKSYESPVFKAVRSGNFKVATVLIEAGAIINDDPSILHQAVYSGKLEIVQLLVKHQVKLFNKMDYSGEGAAITPLELARRLKRPEIIAFLEAAEKTTRVLVTTSQGVITEKQIEQAIYIAQSHTPAVNKGEPLLCLTLIAQRFGGVLSRERDEAMVNRLKECAQKQLRSRKDRQHDHPLFAVVSFLKVIQEKLKLLPATTTITQPIIASTASLLSSSLSSRDGILKPAPLLTTDENHQKKENESVVHSPAL